MKTGQVMFAASTVGESLAVASIGIAITVPANLSGSHAGAPAGGVGACSRSDGGGRAGDRRRRVGPPRAATEDDKDEQNDRLHRDQASSQSSDAWVHRHPLRRRLSKLERV